MSEHLSVQELIQERIKNRPALAGLSINNLAKRPVLRIYDVIGEPYITASAVAEALEDVDAAEIGVHINSPGGDVFESVAIYNLLRSHPAKITTRVDALAASGASVIAQAGDHRIMLESSEMMIHQAHGVAIGATAEQMREVAGLLDNQTEKIAELYARAAGDSDTAPQFLELMSAGGTNMGTWLTAEQAVSAGLADEVVVPSKKTRAEIDPPDRFADELSEAVASVEKVAARAAEVVTMRTEEGKPPLSDEAAALVEQAKAALSGLQAEPESEGINVSSLPPLPEQRLTELEKELSHGRAN